MLLQARGEDVLRVKGLLELDGGAVVLINGVQHVVHTPEHLAPGALPETPPGIVFITRGLEPDRLRESLRVFQRLARSTGGIHAQ
jgi:G3E family GTPase